jgi:hypothetical protein
LSERIFYIGLTLIIISFIACVMNIYLLIFGIPTFLIGIILISLSNRTIKTKIIASITPIILYVPLTFSFLYIYNYSRPKIILIPENFDGNLRIVYEEKCGSNYKETDGIKTLTFPENGILVLNEDFDRHINYNYYLVDRLGNRTEIPQVLSLSKRTQKKSCVLVGGSGTIGQIIEANTTSQDKKGITFSDFYVYNKVTMVREDFKGQQKFDSLTTRIVTDCRLRQ